MNLGAATVIFNGGASFNVTFVGEVKQSVGGAPLVNPIPPGQNLRSSIVPQAGGLSSALGYTPTTDITTYQIAPDGITFLISNYDFSGGGGWDSEPNFGIAEGGYFDAFGGSDNWSRVFTVN